MTFFSFPILLSPPSIWKFTHLYFHGQHIIFFLSTYLCLSLHTDLKQRLLISSSLPGLMLKALLGEHLHKESSLWSSLEEITCCMEMAIATRQDNYTAEASAGRGEPFLPDISLTSSFGSGFHSNAFWNTLGAKSCPGRSAWQDFSEILFPYKSRHCGILTLDLTFQLFLFAFVY